MQHARMGCLNYQVARQCKVSNLTFFVARCTVRLSYCTAPRNQFVSYNDDLDNFNPLKTARYTYTVHRNNNKSLD